MTVSSMARSVKEASNEPTIEVLKTITDAAVPASLPIGSRARLMLVGKNAVWQQLARLNRTSHSRRGGTPLPAMVTPSSAADTAE